MKNRINTGEPKRIVNSIPQQPIKDYSEKHLKFSFEDFDKSQSINLSKWKKTDKKGQTLDNLFHYSYECKMKDVFSDNPKKFKDYPNYPPKSKFKRPKYIPEDALWASMHIGNKPCIIGHIVNDVFYIVFFDPEHEFWPSSKK